MSKKTGIFLLLLTPFFFSCEEEQKSEEVKAIASVGEAILEPSTLYSEIPNELNDEDSIQFAEQYIDSWVREQVILQKAESELPDQAKNVQRQIDKYRTSLLIFAYEKQFIRERLDTVVTENEIQKFYDENQEEFMLRDYIVKAAFARYTSVTPQLEDVAKWYKLKSEDDWKMWYFHANGYAVDQSIDSTKWMYYEDILEKIPLDDYNKTSFIKYKKRTTFEDEGFTYFVNIFDYKLKDEPSPIEFEREKIKGMIINQRMNTLRKTLREELYDDAYQNKQIKINI